MPDEDKNFGVFLDMKTSRASQEYSIFLWVAFYTIDRRDFRYLGEKTPVRTVVPISTICHAVVL